MATNKRKEAPALFELLDKSTLRVPKSNAGSLKIPTWWSNRNPRRPEMPPDENAPPTPDQPQPPITPPFASGPVDFARLLPPANRWFLPVTILLLLLLTLVVVHFVSAGISAPTATGHLPAHLTVPSGRTKIGLGKVPGATEHPLNSRPGRPVQPATGGGGAQQSGRVLPASQVHRYTGHWYLIIVTTRPALAQKAAQFIARHGVDVSVQHDRNGDASVVSVRGFLKRDSPSARRFRQYVVQIGREVGQARRTGHGAWDDAYYVFIHPPKK